MGKSKPTYKQEWSAYNEAQTNEKSKFQALLYELCRGIEEPVQSMGRPRALISHIIFAACVKVYGGLSGRRNQDYLWEAIVRGYLPKPIHYNTISKYLEKVDLTPYLKQLIVESSLPLRSVEFDFAVDSSGFTASRFVRWLHQKYSNPHMIDKQDWLKVHLMCGVKTNIVTAVEVSGRFSGDSPFFEPLVETTYDNFVMNSVSADKAYSSAKNLRLVLVKGAQPYIAFRENTTAKGKKSDSVWKEMFHFYEYNKKWFMEHYHKRSNVEATFSMIKAKFGERIRSKNERAQINEILCKVLCHNICVVIQSMFELGIDPVFWSDDDGQRMLPF